MTPFTKGLMPNRYHIRFQDSIERNLASADVLDRGRLGRLTPQHEVQIAGTDKWFSAEELVGLWIPPAETPPALRTFDIRRWSGILLAGLYFSSNKLPFRPGGWPPPTWNTFRTGVIVAVIVYVAGEYFEFRRPFRSNSASTS